MCVYMAQYFCNCLLDFLPLDTGTNHPQKEINTNHPTNISLQGQKSEGKSNTTLKPGERRPQVEWVREKKKKLKRQRIQHKWKSKVETLDQINEEKLSNLPEKEFRLMTVKILQRLENRMEKMQEAFLIQLI